MELVNWVYILGKTVSVSLHANAIGKGTNPSLLFLATDTE